MRSTRFFVRPAASPRRSFRSRLILLSLPLLAACSSTPKPLPGGPPPEYETPRGYDGGIGEDPPAAATSPGPPPDAPGPAGPPAAAGDAGAPPP